MAFAKIPSKFISRYNPYSLQAKCSKGEISIYKVLSSSGRTQWSWHVYHYRKLTTKDYETGMKNIGHGLVIKHDYGSESSLYKATSLALRKLFSQRRQPLPNLMKMLENDQAMFLIAGL